MRVDFYQLSRDPVEAVVPLLARATKQAGERMLVVSADDEALVRIDRSLWETAPEAFLAHGKAGDPHAARQPLLLSSEPVAVNSAKYLVLADGKWRDEAKVFERTFLLFGDEVIEDARKCWSMLGREGGLERHFWKQEGGKWREMA